MEGFMDTSASFYESSIYQSPYHSPSESDEEMFSLSPSPEQSDWDSFGLNYFEQDTFDLLQPTVQTQLPIPEPIVDSVSVSVSNTLPAQPIAQPQPQPQPILPIQPKPSTQLPVVTIHPSNKASDELSVIVLQKKRGNGGVWQQIQQGERIRVDKTKGKLVKVLVKSAIAAPINFADSSLNVQLFLVDNARPEVMIPQGEGFTIVPSRPTKGAADESSKEFKLKLTKISKSQFFYVTANKLGEQLRGRSLEFRSDDNGKVMNPKKRSRYAMESASPVSSSPMIVPATRASSPVISPAAQIFNNSDIADFIARSLVPVILDSLPQLAPNVNTTTLEDNITKRIKLAFPTAAV